ncbi:MAG: Acetyltransferase [Ignavibacteriaceae bacterium]|nr:Acetyltransferase [Ignavibacteriaceae bacterium]MCK6615881.1 GNAT family N-acetyltransferase [Ignavibacteriaceae bacterium]
MENEPLIVRIIDYHSEDYVREVALRHAVLREPLGLSYTEEQLLAEEEEIHFNAFVGETLAGTLLMKIISADEIKMRQVAVWPGMQKGGIGKALVFYSEGWAKGRGFHYVTLHARDSAVPFYEKLGYTVCGPQFTEVTIPHFAMKKYL